MKIIYKQTSQDILEFSSVGVQNCYLKHLCAENDASRTIDTMHYHTGFEIHFINKGRQEYFSDGKVYMVSDGQIMIVPPGIKHCTTDTANYSSKFSLTFNIIEGSPFECVKDIILCDADERMLNNIKIIMQEEKNGTFFSRQIISRRIFEMLVILLRISGFKEKRAVYETDCEDDRLVFAKNYIKDNIESNIKISDVAAYCTVSTKQLTRIFKKRENITPLGYIQKQKIKHIESLLLKGNTLRCISEQMNFSSEYHFNSFYKKYAGMPPGAYQKMHIQ